MSGFGAPFALRARALYRPRAASNSRFQIRNGPGMGSFLRDISHRQPLALLLILCALAWLPGFFTLPPLDRDESRFAQATKQMLETGDFVNINLGSGPRYEKPVGIYWMQAASTAVLGGGERDAIWTYRVPSFLGALGA